MERITSARELSAYLVDRFRRDGTLPEGVFVNKGELILPIGPELDRFCDVVARLRQRCDKTATLSRHASDNVADLAANRKSDRARERALKRSRRNTKNPKKKGKCR